MVILLGAMAGLGLLLIVVGLTPRPVREPLAAPEPGYATDEDSEGAGAVQQATRRAARLVERDLHSKSMLIQDANMVGRSLETHALHKMAGLVLGAALLAVFGFFANTLFELELPLLVIVAVALAGGLLGWWVPDSILKSEAEKERVLFQQVTESWLELVAQLVTAGADTFGALAAAASYSEQPGFVVIRDALRVSAASGEPPWTGMRRLADGRRLRFLDPFCSALELAGTTGAGSRQAILAQVESARSKAMLEADAAAASSGEKMGAPLALIGGAFMILMGYPPLAGIMDTSTLTGL
jgi:Flp pilus assembly protein TadB